MMMIWGGIIIEIKFKINVMVLKGERKWNRSVVSDPLQPTDCSLPHSFVHGIFQAWVLEWVAISFSEDLPHPGIKPGFCVVGRRFTVWAQIILPPSTHPKLPTPVSGKIAFNEIGPWCHKSWKLLVLNHLTLSQLDLILHPSSTTCDLCGPI